MSKQPVLFREGSRYVLVTNESPRGFKGALFVAWEGETPDSLTETVKTIEQLQALAHRRIELTSIPTEWQIAFAGVTGLPLPIEPTTAESTATKPTAESTAASVGSDKPATPSNPQPATPSNPQPAIQPATQPNPWDQMAPLCVTWVWAFGIATLVAMLLGIIK